MPTYRVGAKGPEVLRIQAQLKSDGFYLGPVDGIFGGGTESAVRQFQKAHRLTVDGQVGHNTWAALFPDVAISERIKSQIEVDFDQISPGLSSDEAEVERLRIIANRRAAAAKAAWVEDVRARKLTIANGQGTVHGNFYDLKQQYGLGLEPF